MQRNIDIPSDGETQEFLALIQQQHAGQKRAGGKEEWQHCEAVAHEVSDALKLEPAITSAKRRELVLGALGHDLYEDTKIHPEEIIARFGANIHDRIMGLTNQEGDDHPEKYVEHLGTATEEDRLIKLADLSNNYRSVAENIEELGRDWVEGWFLPLVEPMYDRVVHTNFDRFPRAAAQLLSRAKDARELLLAAVQKTYTASRSPSSMSIGSPSSLPDSAEHAKESWDFDIFREEYNRVADEQSGWHLPETADELQLSLSYERSSAQTVREFAATRFEYEQRT